jgi:hypothetical protein
MVLAPGASTTIRSEVYTMPEGMGGPHDFAVHLATNDAEHPDWVVHVLTQWGP